MGQAACAIVDAALKVQVSTRIGGVQRYVVYKIRRKITTNQKFLLLWIHCITSTQDIAVTPFFYRKRSTSPSCLPPSLLT